MNSQTAIAIMLTLTLAPLALAQTQNNSTNATPNSTFANMTVTNVTLTNQTANMTHLANTSGDDAITLHDEAPTICNTHCPDPSRKYLGTYPLPTLNELVLLLLIFACPFMGVLKPRIEGFIRKHPTLRKKFHMKTEAEVGAAERALVEKERPTTEFTCPNCKTGFDACCKRCQNREYDGNIETYERRHWANPGFWLTYYIERFCLVANPQTLVNAIRQQHYTLTDGRRLVLVPKVLSNDQYAQYIEEQKRQHGGSSNEPRRNTATQQTKPKAPKAATANGKHANGNGGQETVVIERTAREATEGEDENDDDAADADIAAALPPLDFPPIQPQTRADAPAERASAPKTRTRPQRDEDDEEVLSPGPSTRAPTFTDPHEINESHARRDG